MIKSIQESIHNYGRKTGLFVEVFLETMIWEDKVTTSVNLFIDGKFKDSIEAVGDAAIAAEIDYILKKDADERHSALRTT